VGGAVEHQIGETCSFEVGTAAMPETSTETRKVGSPPGPHPYRRLPPDDRTSAPTPSHLREAAHTRPLAAGARTETIGQNFEKQAREHDRLARDDLD